MQVRLGFGRTNNERRPASFRRNKRTLRRLSVITWIAGLMLTTSVARKERNRVDLSSKDLARHWCKRLKKSRAEIEAAIAKVGDNAETVMKELGVQER
jgi:hypothetical protein